jgi:hypothetical protein
MLATKNQHKRSLIVRSEDKANEQIINVAALGIKPLF